jgi:hypothetical protein
MRSVLPVLTLFIFQGVCEYLDDLVSHIDAPRLEDVSITFFNDIVFDTPQFMQFISRTPKLKAPKAARVGFRGTSDAIARFSPRNGISHFKEFQVSILCRESDWQVSSMEQVFTSCLPPLSTLEVLSIEWDLPWKPDTEDNIENTLWLELLQQFATVKDLYLSRKCAPPIVLALQELVGGRPTEVLPSLQNIYLEELETSGPVQEGIQQFVATRQASHPIAVSRWDTQRRWRWG